MGPKESQVMGFIWRLTLWKDESKRQMSNIISIHSESIDKSFNELVEEFRNIEGHVSELKKERKVLLDTINNLNTEIKNMTSKSTQVEPVVLETVTEIQDVKEECVESPEFHSENGNEGECEELGDNLLIKEIIKEDKSVHQGFKEFVCNVCQFAFSSKENLNIHLENVHKSEERNVGRGHDDKSRNEDDFSKTASSVLNETKISNPKKLLSSRGNGKLQCDICPYTTLRKNNLNRHKKFHNKGVKRFKCELCSYSSASKNALTYHMNSAHYVGEKFECEICPYSTTSNRNLVYHMASAHKIGKTYECDRCPHTSASKRDLRYHKTTVHKIGEMFECDKCPSKSADKGNLERHRAVVHKIGKSVDYVP